MREPATLRSHKCEFRSCRLKTSAICLNHRCEIGLHDISGFGEGFGFTLEDGSEEL